MDQNEAVSVLAGLAAGDRLEIFRLLVKAGTQGLAAGQIGLALQLPAASLSFHLRRLRLAGLVTARRDGASLIYVARAAGVN